MLVNSSNFRIDSIYPKTHSGVYCEPTVHSALLFPFRSSYFPSFGKHVVLKFESF